MKNHSIQFRLCWTSFEIKLCAIEIISKQYVMWNNTRPNLIYFSTSSCLSLGQIELIKYLQFSFTLACSNSVQISDFERISTSFEAFLKGTVSRDGFGCWWYVWLFLGKFFWCSNDFLTQKVYFSQFMQVYVGLIMLARVLSPGFLASFWSADLVTFLQVSTLASHWLEDCANCTVKAGNFVIGV